MPNVTINILKMEGIGKRDWFQRGEETWRDGSKHQYCIFEFNNIIPEPKTEEECEDRYNLNIVPDKYVGTPEDKPWFNWYRWRNHNWGTKWDGFECKIINDNAIKFKTAWSPADGVMQELSRTYYKDRKLLLFYNDEYDGNWYVNEYYNGDITTIGDLGEQIPRYPDNDDYSNILEDLEKEYLKIRR